MHRAILPLTNFATGYFNFATPTSIFLNLSALKSVTKPGGGGSKIVQKSVTLLLSEL